MPRTAFCVPVMVGLLALGASTDALAQSMNASVSGTVADPDGATVPHAVLALKAVATTAEAKFTTGADGFYHFGNLQAGAYELRVSAKGFRDYVQTGIVLSINETASIDIKLTLGTAVQTVQCPPIPAL